MNYQKLVLQFFVLVVVSCNQTDYKKLSYNELPNDVRVKFQERYNYWEPPRVEGKDTLFYMAPFAECVNLNDSCDCKVGAYYKKNQIMAFLNQKLELTICNDKIIMPFSIIESVFIIKNDSIYYPYHYIGKEYNQQGGGTTLGKPRSYDIKIDTINFRAEKMKKSWW